jgi:hypothetical protein
VGKRNTLTNYEVGIIKKLISQGTYSNQEIAGLVNRHRGAAELDISTGRISNIKQGQIKKYAAIPAASDDDVAAFLQAFVSASNGAVDPVSKVALGALFKLKSIAPLALDITETDRIECKKSINFVMKTMAAFANNKGGYLLFGVEDKTWNILGIDEDKFNQYDFNKLNQNILSSLGCGLELSKSLYDVEGIKVGVIYVHPARSKPIIMSQGGSDYPQGSIYFRYPGEDRLISRADLQNILEERLRQLSEAILSKHIANIFKFGVENSAVMNVTTGLVEGKAGNFLIDETLLPSIKFIKEGEFVEKSGAPTLKLIGEVSQTAKVVSKTEKLTDLYPFSWRDLFKRVKASAPQAKQSDINKVIQETGLKEDPNYSAFNFRNKKHADYYQKHKKHLQPAPSLYNQAALDLVVAKLS